MTIADLPKFEPSPKDQLIRDLQTRIKQQRKELRRLNRAIKAKALFAAYLMQKESLARSDAYRHAANIAQWHLFGYRAARRIRKWI